MSVNCCSVECRCGFWSFTHEPDGDVAMGDESLLPIGEYLSLVGSHRSPDNYGHKYGYGYRDDLCGPVYWWDGPNGCGANYDAGPQYTKRLLYTYQPIPEQARYRWRKVQCPVCMVTYAGWYVLQPHGSELSRYTIYDTSFWWAFNDEPDERDLQDQVKWDTATFREMLRQWHVSCGTPAPAAPTGGGAR